jgi:hypothetical protein
MSRHGTFGNRIGIGNRIWNWIGTLAALGALFGPPASACAQSRSGVFTPRRGQSAPRIAANNPSPNPSPQTRPVSVTPVLPTSDGQKWAEYDIRAYTSRSQNQAHPERAFVDWILRDTGTDVWFGEPLGLLSVSRDTLRVYHTPQIHEKVQAVTDRLLNARHPSYSLGMRLVTVAHPNWRAKALPLMQPLSTSSAGVEAWLLTREHAAVFVGDLRRRTDFTEHHALELQIDNGQSQTVAKRQARAFVRSVRLNEGAAAGYETASDTLDEGYSLTLSPLLSLDGQNVDLVLECAVDQIERFVPVSLDIPTGRGTTQRVQIEIPQVASWRIHERFRWPTTQVLLLSCGVVAAPGNTRTTTLGLPINLTAAPPRADALLLFDWRGAADPPMASRPQAVEARKADDPSGGRY